MSTAVLIIIAIVPPLIVAAAAYLIVRHFIENDQKKRILELKYEAKNHTLPMRLQAYERMAMFLERIEPNQLIFRVNNPELSAYQMQTILLATIRSEYEHNLSQQIYISNSVWNKISDAKDDIIDIINAVAATFPPDSESFPFAEALLTAAAEKPVVQQAMAVLKADVQKMF